MKEAAQSVALPFTPVLMRLFSCQSWFRWAVELFNAAIIRTFWPSVNILEQ